MKKLIPVVALLGILVACNSKKKDQARAEDTSTTTTPTTTTPTATPTSTPVAHSNPANDAAALVPGPNTNTNTEDVPQFADKEIQKFVNDYTAFARSYKKGIVDPSKAQALAADKIKWTAKFGINAQKLSTNPEELRKFRTWGEAMNREMATMPK